MKDRRAFVFFPLAVLLGVFLFLTPTYGGGLLEWADQMIATGDPARIDQAITELSSKSKKCKEMEGVSEDMRNYCIEIAQALEALQAARGGN